MSNPYAPPDPSSRPDPSQARPDDDATHHGGGGTGRGSGSGDGGDGGAGSGNGGPDGGRPGNGGSGGRSGRNPNKPQKTERPQPTPEQAAATSRSVLHFGLLMLGAVLTMQLDLPWQLASIAFAVAAVVVGVRAMVRALKEGQRGGIAALLVFGLVLSGMLVVSTISSLVLWNETMERQQCLNSAITVTAQERCEQAYQESIDDRFELIPSDF